MLNYVFNARSISTPYRIINDTSRYNPMTKTKFNQTQRCPSNSINNLLGAYLSLRWYQFGCALDISSFYRNIKLADVDSKTRMLVVNPSPKLKEESIINNMDTDAEGRIYFIRPTLDFGDISASAVTECAMRKLVCQEEMSPFARDVISILRYVDDLTPSRKTREEKEKTVEDITNSCGKYKLKIKSVVEPGTNNPGIIEELQRNKEQVFGSLWELTNDHLLPNIRLSLAVKKRGRLEGPNLGDIVITEEHCTRQNLSKLIPQLFDVSGAILAPIICAGKHLLTKVCKSFNLEELSIPVNTKDKELSKDILNFMCMLQDMDSLKPLPRVLCPEENDVTGMGFYYDGGGSGFGLSSYLLSKNLNEEKLTSNIMLAKSKISKGTVVNNELSGLVLAGSSAEMVVKIMEPYFKEILNLEILLLGDSEVVTKFLNPNLIISHTKTRNSVHATLSNIDRILQLHPTWTIRLGWCPGTSNPSDLVSKHHTDSIRKAEDNFFRHGPAHGSTVHEIMKYEYLTVNKKGTIYKPLDTLKNNKNINESNKISDKDVELTKIYDKHSEDVVERTMKGDNNSFNPLLRNLLYGSFKIKTRSMATNEKSYFPRVDIKLISFNLWSDYKTDLGDAMITREIDWFYHKLLDRHSKLEGLFRTTSHIVRKIMEIWKMEINQESLSTMTWVFLLRSSQENYPIPKEELNKMQWNTMHNITVFDASRNYDVKNYEIMSEIRPVLSNKDPLSKLVINYAHLTMNLAKTDRFLGKFYHKSLNATIAETRVGPERTHICGIINLTRKIYEECKGCKIVNKRIYAGIHKNHATLNIGPTFASVSLDLLGPWSLKKSSNTTKIDKMSVLAIACQNTGAIYMNLMPDATQRSVVSILKKLEARYCPITFISSDAGTQFEKTNFESSEDKRLFHMLQGVYTACARSQWRNFVETRIKKVKKILKSCFGDKIFGNLANLTYIEAEIILEQASRLVNMTPYKIGNSQDIDLSPAKFLCYSGDLSILWPLQEGKSSVTRALNEMREKLADYQRVFIDARRRQINRKADVFGRSKFRFGKYLFSHLPQEGDVCLAEATDGHRMLGIVKEGNDTSAMIKIGDKTTKFPNSKLIPIIKTNELKTENNDCTSSN